METQTDINILIIRHFSGEATLKEKTKIEEWLKQSADNKKLYTDLQEIWLSTGVESNADHYHLEEAIRKFKAQIHQGEQIKMKRFSITLVLKYAAVGILILSLPFSYYFGTQALTTKSSMTTISCAFSDRTTIVLPDSSTVWLNSGSKLSYNPDFNRNTRNVILEGEAFFSVSTDKAHPFHVKTSGIDIEVLGTKFNVKAYAEEKTVSTTLVEGSLHVSSQFQNIMIEPSEKIVFDKASQKMEKQKLSDTSPDTEWKEGRLIFRNESLAELKPMLERWFDVDIEFADEQVKQRRFTGILERESILEAVSYFDLSNLVKCRIQGNKIIIKSE